MQNYQEDLLYQHLLATIVQTGPLLLMLDQLSIFSLLQRLKEQWKVCNCVR